MLKNHNAVAPGSLKPAAPRSRVKHSTTEPLHSQYIVPIMRKFKRVWPRNIRITHFRPYHSTLRKNTRNTYSHMTARTQLKLNNQLALPQRHDCKTRNFNKYYITRKRLITQLKQTMNQQHQNHRLITDISQRHGDLNAF